MTKARLGKRLGAAILAWAILISMAMLPGAFADASDVDAYQTIEDFEGMTADADVTGYWTFGKDGDTPGTLTLAAGKGENGTKATALSYNLCYNWSWMHLAKTIRAEGDGFRVWIKNEHDLYVKANFVSDGMYVGEYQEGVLLAGEHILGVKWADVGIARGQTLQLRLQFAANSDPHAATVYVDDLGFIGAAEQPEEPEKPEDPFGAFAAIQDFEKMSSDADVTRYWALSRDPDTPAPTLTLAEGKGENGSKAAALSYNMPYSWSWMYLAQNVTVSGDAFRLWIKNEHDLYVKANFVSDGAYVGEYQAGVLLAGEHILGIKWADAGFTEGQTSAVPSGVRSGRRDACFHGVYRQHRPDGRRDRTRARRRGIGRG